jgi:hypothetical protein
MEGRLLGKLEEDGNFMGGMKRGRTFADHTTGEICNILPVAK